MIEARDLSREFNGLRAVERVSFQVGKGEIFGFLGHNGAGKTTTIRMLTGQLRPTAGGAAIAGYDIVRDRQQIKPLIGVVFEHQNLYPRMSGRENLSFFADLHQVAGARVDELLEMVGLSERAKAKVKTYSNGMKQRLLIARALLNRPQVLFLDEPTRGLDPSSARDIRRTIQELGAGGTTVFLTTHYMEEADQLCQRVAIISEGRLIALDAPQALKLTHGKRQLRVLLDDQRLEMIDLDEEQSAHRLADWMAQGRILTLHSQEATLEDVFVQLAGRPLE